MNESTYKYDENGSDLPVLAADKLTSSEIEKAKEDFASKGYFILRNKVSTERLAELHSALAQEFDTASKSGGLFAGGGLVSGHLNCFPGGRAIRL